MDFHAEILITFQVLLPSEASFTACSKTCFFSRKPTWKNLLLNLGWDVLFRRKYIRQM